MLEIIQTGIEGFDSVVNGGLPQGSSVIVEGEPGTGKTTFCMQFLVQGIRQFNENGIYITFEETPYKIYRHLNAYGWDLKQYESENRLKVICTSPSLLLEQLKAPGSYLEEMIINLNCRRIVIDSISLFHYLGQSEAELRQIFYTVTNVIQKHKITSLLIAERSRLQNVQTPFENYIADGVLMLSLREQMNKYRVRTIEVLKLRGRLFKEGEHIFRFTNEGIYIIPAYETVEDILFDEKFNDKTPMGLEKIDSLLGGGVPSGSLFLLDINSKANYRYILTSYLVNVLAEGQKAIIQMSDSVTFKTLQELLEKFDTDSLSYCRKQKLKLIEAVNPNISSGILEYTLNFSSMSNEELLNYFNEYIHTEESQSDNCSGRTFILNANMIHSERGADFLSRLLTLGLRSSSDTKITFMVLCNFSEMKEEVASTLRRLSSGIIRTWVDGLYQYVQITKSTNGQMSAPLLLERIKTKPFIRLL